MKVAFVGPIGSGKTTMCDALVSRVGGERMSFAYALKEEVAWALTTSGVSSESREAERRVREVLSSIPKDLLGLLLSSRLDEVIHLLVDPKTKGHFRDLQQWWGTEYRRAQDENYWVNQLVAKISNSEGSVFVDDCRFPNEYEALADAGFTFIRLERNPDFPADPERDAHPSEQYWPTFEVSAEVGWMPLDQRVEKVLEIDPVVVQ